MSLKDKVTGRVKKAAGDLADDPSLRREGRQEERKGEAKEERDRARERADARPTRSRTSSARPDRTALRSRIAGLEPRARRAGRFARSATRRRSGGPGARPCRRAPRIAAGSTASSSAACAASSTSGAAAGRKSAWPTVMPPGAGSRTGRSSPSMRFGGATDCAISRSASTPSARLRIDVALDEPADQVLLVRRHRGRGAVQPPSLLGSQPDEQCGTITHARYPSYRIS